MHESNSTSGYGKPPSVPVIPAPSTEQHEPYRRGLAFGYVFSTPSQFIAGIEVALCTGFILYRRPSPHKSNKSRQI